MNCGQYPENWVWPFFGVCRSRMKNAAGDCQSQTQGPSCVCVWCLSWLESHPGTSHILMRWLILFCFSDRVVNYNRGRCSNQNGLFQNGQAHDVTWARIHPKCTSWVSNNQPFVNMKGSCKSCLPLPRGGWQLSTARSHCDVKLVILFHSERLWDLIRPTYLV